MAPQRGPLYFFNSLLVPRVAIIPGDGIGVEVVREARRLLEELNAAENLGLELVDWNRGAERYLREGVTITDEEFAALEEIQPQRTT